VSGQGDFNFQFAAEALALFFSQAVAMAALLFIIPVFLGKIVFNFVGHRLIDYFVILFVANNFTSINFPGYFHFFIFYFPQTFNPVFDANGNKISSRPGIIIAL